MITVLMATWQGKKYLEQQLDSILAQTVPVRIVISDDGSDDGTRELLERYAEWYPKQIVLHHHQTPQERKALALQKSEGKERQRIPASAQNFFSLMELVAEEDESDYVMLSDQDDVWFNDKVKVLAGRMRQMERQMGKEIPILLHSDMEVVDENLASIAPSFFEYQNCHPERSSFAEVLIENPVTGGACMMNRALLHLVAKAPKSCCMHDWWIALVASCFGVISWGDEALYQYRQHEDNVLGAQKKGLLTAIESRKGRGEEIARAYGQIFAQATAFGHRFWKEMTPEQKSILRAFLALPYQSPAGRVKNIMRHHFCKNSRVQTLAMCVTIPKMAGGQLSLDRLEAQGQRVQKDRPIPWKKEKEDESL